MADLSTITIKGTKYNLKDASARTSLDAKVDKVSGKGLSTNDYSTEEKEKLAGIAAGAEVNVNADWTATEGKAQILNKPAVVSPTVTTSKSGTVTTISITDKDGPHTATINDGIDGVASCKVVGNKLVLSSSGSSSGDSSGSSSESSSLKIYKHTVYGGFGTLVLLTDFPYALQTCTLSSEIGIGLIDGGTGISFNIFTAYYAYSGVSYTANLKISSNNLITAISWQDRYTSGGDVVITYSSLDQYGATSVFDTVEELTEDY